MLQTKETLLQMEREEHEVTRRKLSDSQEKNEELTKKFQGADQKIVELQIELKRLVHNLISSKDYSHIYHNSSEPNTYLISDNLVT